MPSRRAGLLCRCREEPRRPTRSAGGYLVDVRTVPWQYVPRRLHAVRDVGVDRANDRGQRLALSVFSRDPDRVYGYAPAVCVDEQLRTVLADAADRNAAGAAWRAGLAFQPQER